MTSTCDAGCECPGHEIQEDAGFWNSERIEEIRKIMVAEEAEEVPAIGATKASEGIPGLDRAFTQEETDELYDGVRAAHRAEIEARLQR